VSEEIEAEGRIAREHEVKKLYEFVDGMRFGYVTKPT
jgi:hypothetical protein